MNFGKAFPPSLDGVTEEEYTEGRPKSSPDGDLFYALFVCSPAAGRAAKSVRKALLGKAAETDVHAAGFGSKIGGLRPSDTSQFFSTVWSILFLS